MYTKQKQIFDDGTVIVHFTGVQQGDYALCFQDLAGDGANFYGHSALVRSHKASKSKLPRLP